MKITGKNLSPRAKEIYETFANESIKEGRWLSQSELTSFFGIKKDHVKNAFHGIQNLQKKIIKENPGIKKHLVRELVLDEKKWEQIKKEVSKASVVIITGVHPNATINKAFLKTLKLMEKKLNATLLFAPIGRSNNGKEWDGFDKDLASEGKWVIGELPINSNIRFVPIRTSETDKNPLGSLQGLGARSCSIIIGASLQEFDYVPVAPGKLPHGLFSTGSITKPNYFKDSKWIKKGDYVSEEHHEFGCVIVEVADDDIYFPRAVLADEKGRIAYKGLLYDGTKKSVSKFKAKAKFKFTKENPATIEHIQKMNLPVLKVGDTHVGSTCPLVRKALFEVSDQVNAGAWFLNDLFDGKSIYKYGRNDFIGKVKRWENGELELEKELEACAKEVESYLSHNKNLIMVIEASNHNNWLEQYLRSEDIRKEPYNYRIANKLASGLMDGKNPIRYYFEEIYKIKNSERIVWTEENDFVEIYGITSSHGHLGNNGAKPSPVSSLYAHGLSVEAHTHKAQKYRKNYHVGTSTHRNLDYALGGSSWTQSSGVLYPNKTVEIFNFIEGKYQIEGKRKRKKKQ